MIGINHSLFLRLKKARFSPQTKIVTFECSVENGPIVFLLDFPSIHLQEKWEFPRNIHGLSQAWSLWIWMNEFLKLNEFIFPRLKWIFFLISAMFFAHFSICLGVDYGTSDFIWLKTKTKRCIFDGNSTKLSWFFSISYENDDFEIIRWTEKKNDFLVFICGIEIIWNK